MFSPEPETASSHDYRQSTQGRARSPEYRSAANGRSGRPFSSDHSAHGSQRRRHPRQRRFAHEAGFRSRERRDRIDQSGGSEFVRGPRRPAPGACCKPEDQECPATQAVFFASHGADSIESAASQDLHHQYLKAVTPPLSTRSSSARRPFSIAVGVGGQPGMWRSTGTTSPTPPTTA